MVEPQAERRCVGAWVHSCPRSPSVTAPRAPSRRPRCDDESPCMGGNGGSCECRAHAAVPLAPVGPRTTGLGVRPGERVPLPLYPRAGVGASNAGGGGGRALPRHINKRIRCVCVGAALFTHWATRLPELTPSFFPLLAGLASATDSSKGGRGSSARQPPAASSTAGAFRLPRLACVKGTTRRGGHGRPSRGRAVPLPG